MFDRLTRSRSRSAFRRGGDGLAYQIAERGAMAGAQIRAYGQQAGRRSQQAWYGINRYVSRHPAASVGVAFAAGYLTRALMRRY